ncbi:MAG: hypothetical protein J6T10_19530 [Methanobrevibacter sp.]|nr:hypothetical protein [Methanobrevibacter sp.]
MIDYFDYKFDWIISSKVDGPEREMFWSLEARIIGLLNLNFDYILNKYVEELDCYDPMADLRCVVCIEIYRHILRYAPWNQLYYKNMHNDDLLNLIKKGLKTLKMQKKLKNLNEDFAV